jgi:hypothetical protein
MLVSLSKLILYQRGGLAREIGIFARGFCMQFRFTPTVRNNPNWLLTIPEAHDKFHTQARELLLLDQHAVPA